MAKRWHRWVLKHPQFAYVITPLGHAMASSLTDCSCGRTFR